jgi:hypothetical protein
MDDGPDSNAEIIPLEGFTDQEKRLEESFKSLGLSDVIAQQKAAKLELPASDVEFAAQFGILDVNQIEAKIYSDEIEAPKASRLTRFFGGEKPQDIQQQSHSKSPPCQIPAVTRLLSGGSKSMGPINEPKPSVSDSSRS